MQFDWQVRMTKLLMSGLLTLLMTSPVRGTSFSTDNSDLWGAQNEDGWGVQLVQRADVMFASIYAYDADNFPIFYSGALTYAGTNTSGQAVWVGDLYVTSGPWFGAPVFNPSQVLYRKVGQVAYLAQFTETGLLSYSVDGVVVNKQIYRFTLRNDDYSGSYLGTYKLTSSGCPDSAFNGTRYLSVDLTVTQSANVLRIAITDHRDYVCTLSGDYQQFGQFGRSRGTYVCVNGETGSHLLFEANVNYDDIRGRIAGTNSLGCSLSGNFAAIRR